MIRTRKMTPEAYSRQSRDFQFIGRLYDMVLNSVKTNSDLIYSLPNSEDADTAFLELLSMTLGFKTLHNYNVNQLKALCSCFAEIIRNKGNIQSIQMACNALMGAEGINETVYIDDSDYKATLSIYVPQTLSDTNLLRDLLNYILPAGISYNIVKVLSIERSLKTTTGVSHSVKIGYDESGYVSQMSDSFEEKSVIAPGEFAALGMAMNSTVVSQYDTESSLTHKTYGTSPTDAEEESEEEISTLSSEEAENE